MATIEISGEKLAWVLKAVGHATSYGRLDCVYINPRDGHMVGTNGERLHCASINLLDVDPILISASEARKFAYEDTLKIESHDSGLERYVLVNGNPVMAEPGVYPKYSSMISEKRQYSYVIDADEFRGVLRKYTLRKGKDKGIALFGLPAGGHPYIASRNKESKWSMDELSEPFLSPMASKMVGEEISDLPSGIAFNPQLLYDAVKTKRSRRKENSAIEIWMQGQNNFFRIIRDGYLALVISKEMPADYYEMRGT